MSEWPVGALALFILLFLGMPISISLTLIGSIGTLSIIGLEPALSLLGQVFFDNGRAYSLSVLPLFLLMGNLVVQSGIAHDMYDSAYAWVRHKKGGLAIATVVACGGFSSVCGSSLATAATMSKLALPSMRKFKYPDSLSTASIAAGGTIGILIPPSVILVFYGILTRQDIGKLFLAGVIPGLLGVLGYTLAVKFSISYWKMDLPIESKLPLAERIRSLRKTAGALILVVLVMGGIYTGIFTPTESAGIGAAGAFLLTLASGKMNTQMLLTTLYDTVKTTTMMFFILFGALVFTNYVNFSGMTADLQSALAYVGDSPMIIIIAMLLIYLVLGCMLEGLSMMMLTVPIFYPIAAAHGFDLIWFGIFVVVATEISYITPPVGMNAFILHNVAKDVELKTIFRGLVPFVAVDVIRVAILVLFPAIVLFLPSQMS